MGNFTFVNREEELKLLLSFVPPKCHTSSLVIIKAPSGYGKSTLTDRVVEHSKGVELLFAVVDPNIRLKSGGTKVYDGFYIQRCAEDISSRAREYHLPDLKAFMSQRRWKTLREKNSTDLVRKYPTPTAIYENVVGYIDRFFSKGEFDAGKVLTSDTRGAVALCRDYVEFVCDRSSAVSVIREAQHIDHESLRFFLQSNRRLKGQHLFIEYTSEDDRFDPDHEKVLAREMTDRPGALLLLLDRLSREHLEALIRAQVKTDFALTSDYYLKWDGNVRSVMEMKYRVAVGRRIRGPSDLRLSLADLKGSIHDHFMELTRLQKLLLAIVVSHVEAINRHTLFAVAAHMESYSTATERERSLHELLTEHSFLEARYDFLRLQNEDIPGAIAQDAQFAGMSGLAQKGLRDYYMEVIGANDFTAAALPVAVRQALRLCAKTGDTTSTLRLMRHLSDDIRLANDQSMYVDAIAEAVEGVPELFQTEHEEFVDWASALAYDTGDFERAAKLLDTLPGLNVYRGAMLACCAQETGAHQRAVEIVRENRHSWHGADAQLTCDLIELLVARARGETARAREIFDGVFSNSVFRISPLFGYALRFSETINEFPQCTPHILESAEWFERHGLNKSQAYSRLASAMHLARAGEVAPALENVKLASRALVGEIRDQHIILNNRAAVTMLSDRPAFQECVGWLNAAMLTSRDDYSDAVLLTNLAIANAGSGLIGRAVECAERALTILKEPDFADRNIFWSVSFAALNVFHQAGHAERAERARRFPQEEAPRPTIYLDYWEYRFGLRDDVAPKFGYMLRFDYHPLFLSHWLIDHEGLALLKTEPPR
jgi:hypothetical protein